MHIFAPIILSFVTEDRVIAAVHVKTRNFVAAVDRSVHVLIDAGFHHAVARRGPVY